MGSLGGVRSEAHSTDSMDEILDTDSPRERVRVCECVPVWETMGVLGRVRRVPALLCLASPPPASALPVAGAPAEERD